MDEYDAERTLGLGDLLTRPGAYFVGVCSTLTCKSIYEKQENDFREARTISVLQKKTSVRIIDQPEVSEK